MEVMKRWEESSLNHPFLYKTILVLETTFKGILVIKEQLLFEERERQKKEKWEEERKETPKELIKKSYTWLKRKLEI
jgi:hypothetical protein